MDIKKIISQIILKQHELYGEKYPHLNRINESMDSALNVELVLTSDGYEGNFNIGDNKYTIFFIKIGDLENSFLIKFTKNDSYDLVNEKNIKNSLQALATIKSTIMRFIENEKPSVICFSVTDNKISRLKTYSSFSDIIVDTFSYEKYQINKNGLTFFINYKYIDLLNPENYVKLIDGLIKINNLFI